MRVRLSDIREESFSWNETRRPSAGSFEDPRLVGLGEVSWVGELSYAAPEFLLRTKVDYSRQLICDRCLEEFTDEVHEEVALLVQQGPKGGGEELELASADLDVFEVDGDEVDLEPLLAEQILLAIPHRPLCGRPSSAVPSGTPEASAADPRWAALGALKDRLGRDQG